MCGWVQFVLIAPSKDNREGVTEDGVTPLRATTRTMLATLNATDKKNLEEGMQKLVPDDSEFIPYASFFAGTHLIDYVVNTNASELNATFDTTLVWRCVIASERDAAVRNFIESNHEHIELMIEFTSEAGLPKAKDTRSKKYVVVPYMRVILFGFTCTSKSTQNPHASENLGCVQDGTEKTGEAFAETQVVVERHRPEKCYGENLRTLDASTP